MQFGRHWAAVLRTAGGAYPLLIFLVCRNGMDTDGVRGLALLYFAVSLPIVLLALFVANGIARGQRVAKWSTFAICLLVLAALVWWLAPRLQSHYKGFFMLQDLAVFGLLAYYFGSSLRSGRDPLCTYFARLVQDSISPQLLKYTRTLTAVWSAFFLVIGGISTFLFVASTSSIWAFFTNILTPVFVVVFFVIEHACRWLFLPPEDRAGFLKTFTAIRKGGYRGKTRVPTVQVNLAS
jgi:uncharacterized membrane protein